MNELFLGNIEDFLEMAKERKGKAVLEETVLARILKEAKAAIQEKIITDFNKNGNSEFGIQDFEISFDQKKGIFRIWLSDLYYRASGDRACEESCDDDALDQLGVELEQFIKKKAQTEIEAGVNPSFYSK